MKVAVVTGAGRGLGRAFAHALVEAGYGVAALVRSGASVEGTTPFLADVTDARAVRRAMDEVRRTLGPIDLLVNNAGILGPLGPFAESAVEEWWQVLDTNLRGQLLCAHAVLPEMIARRSGRIVNIASGGGATMMPMFSAYITSKTALIRFSECLAAEVREHGVSVFAMGPGTVRTDMSEQSLNSPEGRRWLPWFRAIFDEGRDLPAERPAALLVALASGKADALSGRFLVPGDDLDRLVAQAGEIAREKLYSLEVRRL